MRVSQSECSRTQEFALILYNTVPKVISVTKTRLYFGSGCALEVSILDSITASEDTFALGIYCGAAV